MRSRVIALAIIMHLLVLAGSPGAAAAAAPLQSSLVDVTCTFFDDYVESGLSVDAAMPLAIAVAGDELPTSVLRAFAAIEEGDEPASADRDSLVAYFSSICDPTEASADQTTAAGASGSDPADGAPDSLASTGATTITWFAAGLACMMLASGLWCLHLGRTGLGIEMAQTPPPIRLKPQIRVEPQHRGTQHVGETSRPGERTSTSSPTAAGPRHEFWLLDGNGD